MRWLFTTPAKIDHSRVVAAIARAEARTSGVIRVLIARHRAPDPVAAAQRHFDRLGMAGSPLRNGVLIFVAPRSRRFAIIGDQGVHEKCGESFWQELADAMSQFFKKGDFTEGLVHGVDRAGDLLAAHFPPRSGHAGEPPANVMEVD